MLLFEEKKDFSKEKPCRIRKKPTYKKTDKIKKFLEEWNTIENVELYKPLYDIYSQLFILTQHKKLECLNYYIDIEKDCSKTYTVMYAEIKDTYELPMLKRYNMHKELLNKILLNDESLVYCNTEIQTENEGQLSLFR